MLFSYPGKYNLFLDNGFMNRHFRILLSVLWLGLFSTSHAQSFMVIGEYEHQEKSCSIWDYRTGYDSISAKVVASLSRETSVTILYKTTGASYDTLGILSRIAYYGGVADSIHFRGAQYDNITLGSFGPQSLYVKTAGLTSRSLVSFDPLSGVSAIDQTLPDQLAAILDQPLYRAKINLDNNDLVTDGVGDAWISETVLLQNPGLSSTSITDTISKYLGVNQVHFVTPVFSGLTDSYIKLSQMVHFVDAGTAIVASLPANHSESPVLDTLANRISRLIGGMSEPYKVYRIPIAPLDNGSYPTAASQPFRSYTNIIIRNKTVLIPSFGTNSDETAREIIAMLLPQYEVVQVESKLINQEFNLLNNYSSSIIPNQIGRLIHQPVRGVIPYAESFYFRVRPIGYIYADSMYMYYKKSSDTSFIRKRLLPGCPSFIGYFENLSPNDTISYFLSTWSNLYQITVPLTAPEGYYTFFMDNYTGEKEIVDCQTELYPNPSNGNFAIRFGENQAFPLEITIIDSEGKLIHKESVQHSVKDYSVSLEAPSGIYIIRIKDKKRFTNHKILINK